jgi:hypothetical protein
LWCVGAQQVVATLLTIKSKLHHKKSIIHVLFTHKCSILP